MTTELLATRRALVIGAAQAAVALMLARPAFAAETLPRMTVTRDPNCGCCGGWVAHVKAAGFPVEVIEAVDVAPLKARLGVPRRPGRLPHGGSRRLCRRRARSGRCDQAAARRETASDRFGSCRHAGRISGHGGPWNRARCLRSRSLRAGQPAGVRALSRVASGLISQAAPEERAECVGADEARPRRRRQAGDGRRRNRGVENGKYPPQASGLLNMAP